MGRRARLTTIRIRTLRLSCGGSSDYHLNRLYALALRVRGRQDGLAQHHRLGERHGPQRPGDQGSQGLRRWARGAGLRAGVPGACRRDHRPGVVLCGSGQIAPGDRRNSQPAGCGGSTQGGWSGDGFRRHTGLLAHGRPRHVRPRPERGRRSAQAGVRIADHQHHAGCCTAETTLDSRRSDDVARWVGRRL